MLAPHGAPSASVSCCLCGATIESEGGSSAVQAIAQPQPLASMGGTEGVVVYTVADSHMDFKSTSLAGQIVRNALCCQVWVHLNK